ncbi:hypothetical protein Ais01nite_36690 [Asanoa ishikariensis]|uniref:Polynucleotide kinase PNKP phosphatase domain-containing protein n=1 Tax=Asanoa ishikariensis TaxID=137265 RepID=A0A1H3LQA5_9ACTN|nr:hypothetical protein [Asanoa ishikariensis]GIF65634.1 hypothetical protein Ais01nite_36690 [Asanoa ishikariensis]SDY66747.1 hypothetical protein SAMN05421684_0908 [Asanoa ishikariensis]
MTSIDPPVTRRQRAVLVDVDGTLAIRGKRSPYDWSRVGEDQPNPAVIELVQTVSAAGRHRIVVMSGRKEQCRQQTEMWLDAQGIEFDDLFLRADHDDRPDHKTKADLYRRFVAPRYEVAFVIDDRDSVVRMWRTVFKLTVCQVADGDF